MPRVHDIPGPYHFFFYSLDCNEPIHVHVRRDRMVCKFWLDPVELVTSHGFAARELTTIRNLIRRHRNVIIEAWHEHCDQS